MKMLRSIQVYLALPLGLLIYDQSGHVAAQLSRRDPTVAMIREECQAAATKGTSDTAQTVLGYDAYFGTYRINEKDGIVTHHLEAAIWPRDIGKDIDRHFTISIRSSGSESPSPRTTRAWSKARKRP